MEELAPIGYLQYTEVKKDGRVRSQIRKRDPDLSLNNIQPPPDGDGESDANEENNGTSGRNNGEPLEGGLCPPDEPIGEDETLTIHDLTTEELHYIRSLRNQKGNNPAS